MKTWKFTALGSQDNGDDDLTPGMKNAISNRIPFTETMRDTFFKKLLKSVKQLQKKHTKIVVAQTYIKEKYRMLFLQEFKDIQFILVEADTKLRELRLSQRTSYPLDIEYARTMCLNFEKPHIEYVSINNDMDGEWSIIKQLQKIIAK